MAAARPVPTRYGERDVYAVSAFNQGIAGYLARLPAVWVEGEVCELRRQEAWGRVYWTLKDLAGAASVRVQMNRVVFDRLTQPPRDGERVHVLGRVNASEKTAELALQALRLEPFGIGSLLAQLEQLKRRLAVEGLFAASRKRPLPFMPRLIGLVCGADAAVKHDVVTNAQQRFAPAKFRIVECVLQGPQAPQRIVTAMTTLAADEAVDVIVLARGGGSVEDLAPFSDERVCRAVAACRVPVVSAIGHEQDTPICDLVADVRASTPTHAARLVVPDAAALIDESRRRLHTAFRLVCERLQRERAALEALATRPLRLVSERVARDRSALAALAARPVLRRPDGFLELRRTHITTSRSRLTSAEDRLFEREKRRLDALAAQLRALGPATTLKRGYAIALGPTGAVLREAAQVEAGDDVTVRLGQGSLATRVLEAAP